MATTVTEISVPFVEQLVAIVVEPSFLINPKSLALLTIVLVLTIAIYTYTSSRKVYLIDFVCFKAPKTHRVPLSTFIEHAEIMEKFDRDTIDFQTKVVERSGIGNQSYLPDGIHFLPPSSALKQGIHELEMVLFSTVGNLFTKLKISPESIDVLITNCSLVTPTPSLSSMVINKFGFRSNVISYNLSGMGCSAGLLSLSLAKDMLKVHKNLTVLIVSTEAISPSIYEGKIKSMLVSNCIFRMGGAVLLLSNNKSDRNRARYELQHVVTTNIGAKDVSYKCVFQEADCEGYTGMILSRSILQVASEALRKNLATLAAATLPYTELIRYGVKVAWKGRGRGLEIPDFKKAFDHFCIHAGGKAVIDGMKKTLRLSDRDVEASKMTLHRYGNTSSSSVWYSLSYLEAKGRVRRGDKVWQLGFGSGFKCNSAVWKCISNMKSDYWNAWSDSIDQYPLEVPDSADH
ncbi:3-ketoacyl-CoA synthase 7 [Linum perenne]